MDATQSQNTAEEYDVFVSYADADRQWVECELLPRLKKVDLKSCMGLSDFELGAQIAEELEKAITHYPKTLLILSPDYLDYRWKLIDKMEVLDPSAKMRKFIPVVLRACEIPLYIRTLISLDFTTSENQVQGWNRLIDTLLQSRDFELKKHTSGGAQKVVILPTEKWYKDAFLNQIERKLRMNTAHWIEAGFSIPQNQFSFTAVFFENQIEILGRLEIEINSICQQLLVDQGDIAAKPFHTNLNMILDIVLIRSNQLANAIGKESRHELSITLDKALEMLVNEVEDVKTFLFEASVQGILHAEGQNKSRSELRMKLYMLVGSIQNLIQFSEIIKNRAVEEWETRQ